METRPQKTYKMVRDMVFCLIERENKKKPRKLKKEEFVRKMSQRKDGET